MSKCVHGIAAAVIALSASTTAHAETPSADSARAFPNRVLAAHNWVRRSAGVTPLRWDDRLGIEAARYAVELAINGTFVHSAANSRGGAGENLWMGTRGAFTVEAMVASWASEQRLFTPGTFPNVSRDGNWHQIGHYSQMIWPTTQRVGCALATNASTDYLVCRYSPAGNVYGAAILVH